MSAARSPFPSPSFPWHIAQSYPYIFFPAATDAAVGFTGFATFAASGGILNSAAGAAGFASCCAETEKQEIARIETTRKMIRMEPPKSKAAVTGFEGFYSGEAAAGRKLCSVFSFRDAGTATPAGESGVRKRLIKSARVF